MMPLVSLFTISNVMSGGMVNSSHSLLVMWDDTYIL